MYTGVFFGLATAFIWATTSMLVKAHSERIDTVSFNAFRLVIASLFFLALLPFFGGLDALNGLSTSSRLALFISITVGVAVGDSLYFWSMTQIGASRALPVANVYPVFTFALAVPFLGEAITPLALPGMALALAGIYLLAPPPPAAPIGARANRAGILAAISAAFLWAVATLMMKVGLQDNVDSFVVNAFRLPIGAVVLGVFVLAWRRADAWRGYDRSNLATLIAISLYSTGLGAIAWVLSVEYSGAARAALFNTMAPLMGVPLSVIFLRERVTWRIGVGTILAILGVWLVL